jgi:hypothetical protein
MRMDQTTVAPPSADDVLRASVADMPIPSFEPAAFKIPPALETARLAVVTTAALMRHGEAPWTHDDAGFRVFESDEAGLFCGHVSMSLDRVGMFVDRNVFYPLDRLAELAASGTIGAVGPHHISFMGALRGPGEIATLMLDSGPQAARLLREDGVDAVLLTPVCPGCSRTTLILAHVLEAHGLSTVLLASNLAHARKARAPRALFCDFPLGRPLGRPKDPEFQHRVLAAALDMFARADGPVLEIFPEAIKDEYDAPLACALPPRYDPQLPPAVDEAGGLRPAWERARRRNGGTHVGRRVSPNEVPDAIRCFLGIAQGEPWQAFFPSEDHMLQTAMDIRIYYEEAATALADHVPAARAAEAWFYRNTEAGRTFREVFHHLRASGEEKNLSIAALYYIVPLSQAEGDPTRPPWGSGVSDARRV